MFAEAYYRKRLTLLYLSVFDEWGEKTYETESYPENYTFSGSGSHSFFHLVGLYHSKAF
jgi:hypothetical protein